MPKAKRAVNVSAPATPAKLAKLTRKLSTPIPANKALATLPGGFLTRSTIEPGTVNTAKPAATDTTTDTATMPRGLTRDAAGIVRYATNYNQYSDRDTAYLVFIGAVCRANAGTATLRQIHDAGITRSGMPDRKRYNPHYTGSGKATDIGAINRLCKAGYFTRAIDGNTLTPTKLALASKAYLGTQ